MIRFGIIIILAILASCQANNKYGKLRQGEVVVEGQVELNDSSSKAVTLIHGNRISGTEIKTEVLDSTGRFLFEFEILHPHHITVRYDKGNAGLFAHPGDSLYLTFNASAFQKEKFPDYEISGNSVESSKNIQHFFKYEEQLGEDFNPEKYSILSVKDYLKKLKQQMSHEDSVLSVFCEKYHPNREFVTWAENYITYQNANYLIYYNYYNRDLKHEESRVLFDKTLFPVSNDNAFVSRLYALHLRHYASHKYYGADSMQSLLDNDQYETAYRRWLNQIIKHEEPGLSREVMCYKVISFIDEEEHFDAFSSIWKDRVKFIRNEILLSLLEENLLVETRNQKIQQQVTDKENTGSHISYVKYQSNEQGKIVGDLSDHFAQKYKGKVVYMDIWATWCGPCRSEFPHMIDLHEQYKDEPVVFVSLCLASDRSDWKEAIKSQNIPGERYYFSKTQTNKLRNQLDFTGYPTYMLIDRNGNLVDKQAPRPSSGEKIKSKLDELVEN